MINIEQIIKMIPHRYPLLLVDRVIEVNPMESAVGLKNVTFNEPHFMGHFPDKPVMPGVLIVEAMAQTSAVLVAQSIENMENKLVYFMSIENAKFRQIVSPGDTMKIHIQKKQNRNNVWKFEGKCYVEEKLVAEASFTAMIVDK